MMDRYEAARAESHQRNAKAFNRDMLLAMLVVGQFGGSMKRLARRRLAQLEEEPA